MGDEGGVVASGDRAAMISMDSDVDVALRERLKALKEARKKKNKGCPMPTTVATTNRRANEPEASKREGNDPEVLYIQSQSR